MPNAPYMEFITGRRCAQVGGFTLHANVQIHGSNRRRLERLCRYVARGAIAQDRLRLLDDGRVYYHLRRAWHDDTKAMIFEPLTFIEKLCALVPPPRQHLVSYHGILAPNARFRQGRGGR
ncbi:MAG: transposase [Planctomycetota bacterium]